MCMYVYVYIYIYIVKHSIQFPPIGLEIMFGSCDLHLALGIHRCTCKYEFEVNNESILFFFFFPVSGGLL